MHYLHKSNTGKIYKNFIWESVERINSNINNEFGELLENLEVDNQQPSINLKD
jgi:tRNA U54 and U55 pseudouridine synthase Pus10